MMLGQCLTDTQYHSVRIQVTAQRDRVSGLWWFMRDGPRRMRGTGALGRGDTGSQVLSGLGLKACRGDWAGSYGVAKGQYAAWKQ